MRLSSAPRLVLLRAGVPCSGLIPPADVARGGHARFPASNTTGRSTAPVKPRRSESDGIFLVASECLTYGKLAFDSTASIESHHVIG